MRCVISVYVSKSRSTTLPWKIKTKSRRSTEYLTDPPPSPCSSGYTPKANMTISVPAEQWHEDSDNGTQINSPSFDL